MSTELYAALGHAVVAARPDAGSGVVAARVRALAETGAYVLINGKLSPTGNRRALAAANEIDPIVSAQIAQSSVAHIDDPARRTIAQLRALGGNPADIFDSSDVDGDDVLFEQVAGQQRKGDLSSLREDELVDLAERLDVELGRRGLGGDDDDAA